MSITDTKESGRVSKAYLEKYPHLPSLTLAQLMLKERPDVFSNVNNARRIIRYYRGACGDVERHKVKDIAHLREHGSVKDRAEPALPKPIDDLFNWAVQPVEFERAICLPDIHLPYHDLNNLRDAIGYGRKRKADCIILQGDVLDFYSCSFFDQDPNHWDAAVEQRQGTEFLSYLRETFPKAQIIYLEGNHEERIWRYVARKAPALMNCKQVDGKTPLVSLAGFLPFERLGVRLVDNKQPLLVCDKLYVTHGHEFPTPFTNPVNPARGLFLQSGANAVCAHLHQSSTHTQTGLGSPVSCFSFGALCNLRPRYRPLNKWNAGFGIIETHGGAWSVESKKIISGKIV